MLRNDTFQEVGRSVSVLKDNYKGFPCLQHTIVSWQLISSRQQCKNVFMEKSYNSNNLQGRRLFTSRPFLKTAGGIVLGSVAVSAVSADVLPYISVAIQASFLKLGMCNICKNNIAKMFLDF